EINRGLPAALLVKYFRKLRTDWLIRDEVRERAEFVALDWAGAWPELPAPDVVFLRNALGTVAPDVRRGVIQRLRAVARCSGRLLLGDLGTAADGELVRVAAGRSGYYSLPEEEKAFPVPVAAAQPVFVDGGSDAALDAEWTRQVVDLLSCLCIV